MTRPTGRPRGRPRGRPNIDPEFKYANEIRIWLGAGIAWGCKLRCATEAKAIDLAYRLHRARKALRDQKGEGWHSFDAFVVRKRVIDGYWWVLLELSQPMDLSGLQTLDGQPIDTSNLTLHPPTPKDIDWAKPYDPNKIDLE